MSIRKNLPTRIQAIYSASREAAIRSVGHHRVCIHGRIGQKIFEEEQGARNRAESGTYLIKSISQELQPVYGSRFSVRQLKRYRQFYQTFPITSTLRTQFNWMHYKLLMSIDKEAKREFYIAETEKNKWTARQLERQINSQLSERLLLGKNAEAVLAVTRNEKQPSDAKDTIKDLLVRKNRRIPHVRKQGTMILEP